MENAGHTDGDLTRLDLRLTARLLAAVRRRLAVDSLALDDVVEAALQRYGAMAEGGPAQPG